MMTKIPVIGQICTPAKKPENVVKPMGGHVAVEDDDVIVEDDEKPGKYIFFSSPYFPGHCPWGPVFANVDVEFWGRLG